MTRITRCLAAGAALAALAPPAPAQEVCRPTALGSVACLGPSVPPPPPRNPTARERTGLDAVLDQRPPEAFTRDLIPSRRTNSFGDTLIERGARGSGGGPCSRVALGHLRCR